MEGIMEREGTHWVPKALAAQMIGVRLNGIDWYVKQKRLTLRLFGKYCFYPLAEVEALARDPERLRREDNRKWRQARRVELAAMPYDRVNVKRAAALLERSEARVKQMVYKGQLAAFQEVANWSRLWFDRAEVLALKGRLAEARTQKARTQAVNCHVTRVRIRPKLQRSRTIQPGELSEFERYYGEWLTTRQVAMRLGISMASVYALRRTGRLPGEKRPTWFRSDKLQWHYRKVDVYALRDDPKYQANNRKYWAYRTPEGIAWRTEQEAETKAAQFTRQLEICTDLREKGLFADAKRNLLLRRW